MEIPSIPRSTAPFFQEYDFALLDPIRDKSLILERILAYGNRAELHWLFGFYGRDTVRSWVRESGHSRLPFKRYNLWCILLDISRLQTPENKIWKY